MFDATKVAALKTLGFSDDDIAGLQAQASATEKAATEQGVAYKADEPRTLGLHAGNYTGDFANGPTEHPDVIINGVTYKAFKPIEEATTEVVEEDAIEEMPAEDEAPADDTALTLSSGDLAAISQAIGDALSAAVAQIMGGLDLEKKVAGHVQGFLAPLQQAQTTKDAEQAQTRDTVAQLQQQVKELTGDQPAAPYRASAAKDNVLSDATMLAAAKQLTDPDAGDPWADIKRGLGLSRPQ